MCGRTACNLGPEVICRACTYQDGGSGNYRQPEWRDGNNDSGQGKFYPSVNIAPTKFTPILFKDEKTKEVLIQPMMWGMIPFWHKGDPKGHKLSTNNCRLEGMLSSKLYKHSLNARRSCVVPVQGFYEWKTNGVEGTKQPKQPFFIYSPQSDETIVEENSISQPRLWNEGVWTEENGWKGPKMLMMAGLYDVWKDEEGNEVYNYTIITMESNETLSWLHHRMPAILDTPEEVETWLNFGNQEDVLKVLKPTMKLEWYPVSQKVNNARCHDSDCMERVEPNQANPKTKKESAFMQNWLKKKTDPKEEDESSSTKKPKKEEK